MYILYSGHYSGLWMMVLQPEIFAMRKRNGKSNEHIAICSDIKIFCVETFYCPPIFIKIR